MAYFKLYEMWRWLKKPAFIIMGRPILKILGRYILTIFILIPSLILILIASHWAFYMFYCQWYDFCLDLLNTQIQIVLRLRLYKEHLWPSYFCLKTPYLGHNGDLTHLWTSYHNLVFRDLGALFCPCVRAIFFSFSLPADLKWCCPPP